MPRAESDRGGGGASAADATSAPAGTLDVREGLRRVCRTAVPQVGDPDRILRHLYTTYQHLYGEATAGCVYAPPGRNPANEWQLTCAGAGHPPPC
ncbi:SpoIIE family protein phosphatase [Streptomyces puniciscabiei]|uniref:SpoIIE family protein phosphatase n=1 Tax=Streptomyces puniciscabiei TaxID=164348 RepID=UPI0006EB9D10|nr:SpoIIE family protein phosphatase [Streptomyces puniciscabiei]